MDRGITQRTLQRSADSHAADGPGFEPKPHAARLPPTRAARSARSRGVFLAGHGELGSVHGLLSVLSIAATVAWLVAAAPSVIDAPLVTRNPGPELVATTTQLPTVLLGSPR